MSEEKGTPLPGLVGAGFGPETIKAIFDIVKNFKNDKGESVGSMLQEITAENVPQAKNHVLLSMENIKAATEMFDTETVVKYILIQDKLLVQEEKHLNFFSNYAGLVDYPNIFEKAWILSKPKLAKEGIIFDTDELLPPDTELSVMAVAIEDENLTVPENERPLAGCIIKLYIAKVQTSEK